MKYITTKSGRISRTQMLSILSGIIGATIIALPELRGSIPTEAYGVLLLILSIANSVLRVLTSEPVKR